jgi:hypothetical protein
MFFQILIFKFKLLRKVYFHSFFIPYVPFLFLKLQIFNSLNFHMLK